MGWWIWVIRSISASIRNEFARGNCHINGIESFQSYVNGGLQNSRAFPDIPPQRGPPQRGPRSARTTVIDSASRSSIRSSSVPDTGSSARPMTAAYCSRDSLILLISPRSPIFRDPGSGRPRPRAPQRRAGPAANVAPGANARVRGHRDRACADSADARSGRRNHAETR